MPSEQACAVKVPIAFWRDATIETPALKDGTSMDGVNGYSADVLCVFKSKHGMCYYFVGRYEEDRWGNGCWFRDESDDCPRDSVTHWMPLPKEP